MPAKEIDAAQGNLMAPSDPQSETAEIKGSTTQERPTLKTIAQLSGLAIQTVSRALGDAPDIS